MMWLRSCPRCELGDLYMDEDELRHCMQCGHVQYSANDKIGAFDLARILSIGEERWTTSDGTVGVDHRPALAVQV